MFPLLLGLLLACGDKEDTIDEELTADADGDGYAAPSDCDDASSAIHPGAEERCDGFDNNCDGLVDQDAVDADLLYSDSDGDGFGDEGSGAASCTPGEVTAAGDCDDGDAEVHPGAIETDCSETRDLDCDGRPAYVDADDDGWSACLECDDADALVNPDMPETCNGIDDDCDGYADGEDALDASSWFVDLDGDGHGVPGDPIRSCEAPGDNYAATDDDCDDTDTGVAPGAGELCDGVDQDCDGAIDEEAEDAPLWYADADGDGYGSTMGAVASCSNPGGALAAGTDCDDTDDAVHPGASEVCDAADTDEDCDGLADDDDPTVTGWTTWYTDSDSDGFGETSASTRACTAPAGSAAVGGDCQDTDASVSPAAVELCNDGLDNDCDGTFNGCGLSGSTDLSTADASWEGETSYDWLGGGLSFVGDVDGDGAPDLALGADGYDLSSSVFHAGRTYIISGAALGTPLASVTASVTGTTKSLQSGHAVDGVGDLDGDGNDDLAIGAPGSAGGRAFIFAGPITTALTTSDADTAVKETKVDDYCGYVVRSVGDLYGDGRDDLAVGAYGYDSGSTYEAGGLAIYSDPLSSATLYFSSADTRVTGATNYDRLGAYIAEAADYDGDGFDDLATAAVGYDSGTISKAGAAYIFSGPLGTGTIQVALYTTRIEGTSTNGALGHGISAPGDVNGDGFDDLLVGAYDADGAATATGAAYLFLGGGGGIASGTDASANATIEGETSYDGTGGGVSGGDLDADGLSDLVIGEPYHSPTGATNGGRILLFYGPVTGTLRSSDADWVADGSGRTTYFGGDVDATSDINLDGANDILVGGSGWTSTTTLNQAGGAWLFLGGGL